MTVLLYAELKLKSGKKDEFLDLISSPEGFPITKSKPGFISAETGMIYDIVQSIIFVSLVMITLESKKFLDTKLILPSRDII